MDDAARVRRDERVRDGDGNPERLVQPHPLAWNERIQALAADVLHHDEVVPVGRLDLVNRDDVRVVRADAACASCTKRRRRFVRQRSAGRTLMATSRPRRVSRARYTSPMPPAPMRERTS